jgi:hypothetical protein
MTDTTLKLADAAAGIPNCPLAFSAPIAWAARAMNSRNGAMMRAITMVSSRLPGVWAKPGAIRSTTAGMNRINSRQMTPTTGTRTVVSRL